MQNSRSVCTCVYPDCGIKFVGDIDECFCSIHIVEVYGEHMLNNIMKSTSNVDDLTKETEKFDSFEIFKKEIIDDQSNSLFNKINHLNNSDDSEDDYVNINDDSDEEFNSLEKDHSDDFSSRFNHLGFNPGFNNGFNLGFNNSNFNNSSFNDSSFNNSSLDNLDDVHHKTEADIDIENFNNNNYNNKIIFNDKNNLFGRSDSDYRKGDYKMGEFRSRTSEFEENRIFSNKAYEAAQKRIQEEKERKIKEIEKAKEQAINTQKQQDDIQKNYELFLSQKNKTNKVENNDSLYDMDESMYDMDELMCDDVCIDTDYIQNDEDYVDDEE